MLHWAGSVMHGQNDITEIYGKYLDNHDEFLVMGHIIDGKEHGVGRSWDSGDYYFLYPITAVVNLNVFKRLGKPKCGQGIHDEQLWIANRDENNVHDNYTPVALYSGTGTKKVSTKSFGWNLISESLKNYICLLYTSDAADE